MNNVNVFVMNNVMNPLFSFSQITLVDRKILVSEWICISNSVITLVDERPKNRLQLINFKRSQKVPRKLKREVFGSVKLNDGTFIRLISEFSQTICAWWKSERSFNFSSKTNIRSRRVFPSPFNLDICTANWTTETEGIYWEKALLNPLMSRWSAPFEFSSCRGKTRFTHAISANKPAK